VSELETRSRAFKLHCSRCSLGLFCWGSRGRCGRRGRRGWRGDVGDMFNADEAGGTGFSAIVMDATV
jgi:hypothetical protein